MMGVGIKETGHRRGTGCYRTEMGSTFSLATLGYLLNFALSNFLAIYLFVRFYLFIHVRYRERNRLHAGSPMWDLILGLQDQALG